MQVNKEFLDKLSPVELEFVKTYLSNIYDQKVSDQTSNYDNLVSQVCSCPNCKSTRIVKNGFNPGHKQEFRCKDCSTVFLPTTGTLFSHSKTSYQTWSKFIECEMNGFTLEQEKYYSGLSVTTCFNMRHKLYSAISKIQENVTLKGLIELDPSYTKINLKGTKHENMPRISKKRGKHKTYMFGKNLAGISHHKVCLVAAVDENDNILFKIAGLGPETLEKMNQFKENFQQGSTIITDSKPCLKKFANLNGMTSEEIPVIANRQRFTTDNGNSLSSVNELHTEIKNMMTAKHGVSTRHLQGYLDWFVFKKKLKYTLDMKLWEFKSYTFAMAEQIKLSAKAISQKLMPIDLFEAYGEYHYGIFANQ